MKDTHVHISLEAHGLAKKAARARKVSIKDFVSAAIKAEAKRAGKAK